MAKLTEKEVQDILGVQTKGLNDEQSAFIGAMVGGLTDAINKSIEGLTDSEALKSAIDGLKSLNSEELEKLKSENAALVEQVKSVAAAMDKMKKYGVGGDFAAKYNEKFDAMYDSPKFQDFLAGKEKNSGSFSFKDVSMTGNYTGTALITDQSDRIVTQATDKKIHVRDFATVLQGDPEYPIFAFQQIYEVNKNARYLAENGRLPESSLKVKEESAQVSRVGTHFKLSKRALKCRTFLRGFVLTCVMSAVRDAEDFAILFGDGSGDNLKGITKYEGVKSVESIVSETLIAGEAGSVAAIEQAENGVIIELAAAHDLLIEGLRITFVGAGTNTVLNGTFDVIKANDTRIFLEGVALTDTAADKLKADAAAMTFKVTNGAFKSVESPNSIDALETAVAVMTYAQFQPSVLVLNPITLNSIRTEKATDGNRLEVVKDVNGNPVIAGLRVIPYTGIPAGKYFLGDMNLGAQIIDYTPLTVEWADDVETKLKNQIVLLGQAEMIVPVYCPWAFAYGSISALKAAISKD
jgi:HK97 family phage major capsid protein